MACSRQASTASSFDNLKNIRLSQKPTIAFKTTHVFPNMTIARLVQAQFGSSYGIDASCPSASLQAHIEYETFNQDGASFDRVVVDNFTITTKQAFRLNSLATERDYLVDSRTCTIGRGAQYITYHLQQQRFERFESQAIKTCTANGRWIDVGHSMVIQVPMTINDQLSPLTKQEQSEIIQAETTRDGYRFAWNRLANGSSLRKGAHRT
ncbi:hypothetical protein OIO90_001508 [Microbotryomycetes sp. JL221]|nr:hypothetical protein OIO90_001508 [Microbotryomycetes sp. JL221]